MVELTKIPALAYKFKMSSGGAGIKIIHEGSDNIETFAITRRGELVATTPQSIVSDAAREAFELTQGLPYSARGKVKAIFVADVVEDELAPDTPEYNMVESDEYEAWVAAYTGDNFKMNYAKMNKDMIQFAVKNKTVAQMVSEKEPVEAILRRIVQIQTSNLTKKKEYLAPEMTDALIATLEELDVRSAFKELKLHIQKMYKK
ncbi:MAG: hypothetical protein FWE59_04780 [Oscillospiraceae bacterium]|nr:hypothetical protein [Oscillospiraceae bacterium]